LITVGVCAKAIIGVADREQASNPSNSVETFMVSPPFETIDL
jgi:hypothetical protein